MGDTSEEDALKFVHIRVEMEHHLMGGYQMEPK